LQALPYTIRRGTEKYELYHYLVILIKRMSLCKTMQQIYFYHAQSITQHRKLPSLYKTPFRPQVHENNDGYL